jgi:predicted CoA-binding protein
MQIGRILTEDDDLRSILAAARSVAVVGLSPKPDRESYEVAAYLQQNGYRVIPVRPAQAQILGEKAYASLNDIPGTVDIVDVFRSPDQVLPHAREALRLKPQLFWLQEGIENHEAAALLTAAGIHVVMNRCIKREHVRLGI